MTVVYVDHSTPFFHLLERSHVGFFAKLHWENHGPPKTLCDWSSPVGHIRYCKTESIQQAAAGASSMPNPKDDDNNTLLTLTR